MIFRAALTDGGTRQFAPLFGWTVEQDVEWLLVEMPDATAKDLLGGDWTYQNEQLGQPFISIVRNADGKGLSVNVGFGLIAT